MADDDSSPGTGLRLGRRDLVKGLGAATFVSTAGCVSSTGRPRSASDVVFGYGGFPMHAARRATAGTTANVSLPPPIARWTLDEPGGTTVHDVSAGHDGDLVGAPTLGEPGVRGAGSLDCRPTTGNYAVVPHADSLTPPDTLTVAGWFRTSARAKNQTLVQKADAYWGGAGFVLAVQHKNRIRATVGVDSGTASVTSRGHLGAHDGAWHHLAATWDGETLELYYDGTRLGRDSAHSGGVTAAATDLYLGHGQNANGHGDYDLAGSLDDVRLYDVALPAAAVRALVDGTTTTGTVTPTPTVTPTTTFTPTTPTATTTATTAPPTTTTPPSTASSTTPTATPTATPTPTSTATPTTTWSDSSGSGGTGGSNGSGSGSTTTTQDPTTTTSQPTTTTTSQPTTTTTSQPTTTTTSQPTTTTTSQPTTTTTSQPTTTTQDTTTTTSQSTTTVADEYGQQGYGEYGYGGVTN